MLALGSGCAQKAKGKRKRGIFKVFLIVYFVSTKCSYRKKREVLLRHQNIFFFTRARKIFFKLFFFFFFSLLLKNLHFLRYEHFVLDNLPINKFDR